MRALVQTVSRASVTVDGTVVGAIGDGLLVLVGVTHSDTDATAKELARKVYELRILDDERSAADVAAPVLVVSQFTLLRRCAQGTPPDLGSGGAGRGRRAAGGRVRRGAARTGRFCGYREVPGAHAGGERQCRASDSTAGTVI